jgi:integrase
MGKFAKKDPLEVAKKQAANVMRTIQGTHIKSVGTVRNYEEALSRVAQYVNQALSIGLREITPEQALSYLEQRSEEVGQKTLDMERQAIQAMMHFTSKKLPLDVRLERVKSEHEQILKSRAYTPEQVRLISTAQQSQNALSTQIAYAAGLRGHELFTLRRIEERAPSDRPALDTKFQGRDGDRYTVHGKGGLVREVCIPRPLAEQLEAKRFTEPRTVTDRGINYQQHYDIGAGKSWATSFSSAATRTLGWSEGAHGVRHSYAQERMYELQNAGMTRSLALEVVSQEMGHFRPDITETYLR